MIRAVRLGVRLAWGQARAGRMRAIWVAVAMLIGTVILLTVAGITHSEHLQHPEALSKVENQRLLLAVVVAVAFPVVVLASSVARLSADLRDRRMANLRLLGLSTTQVRLVAAVEVGAAAITGSLVGAVVFVPVRRLVAQLEVAGRHWPLETVWPDGGTWPAIVLGLPLVVMAVSALPSRLRTGDALARARRADAARPAWWRVIPLLVGVVCCLYVQSADPAHGLGHSVIGALFVGIVALALGIILVVPIFVRLFADLVLRVSSRPTPRVAARRLQAQPAAVSRVISGLLIGLFVVVGARSVVAAFESTGQYESAAYQIEQQQLITGNASAAKAAHTVDRLKQVRGVEQVLAWPDLHAPCGEHADGRGHCFAAVVATCSQIHEVFPQLTGCVPGKALVVSDWAVDRSGHLPTLRPEYDHEPSEGRAPTVRVQDWTTPTSSDETAWHLERLGISVVVPPDAPGVAEAVGVANRTLVVTAPPGRWLADRVSRAGLPLARYQDLSYYDFVKALRAMVYAVASVIVCVGLLAFGVTAVDRAVARRREVTSLQIIGIPRRALRGSQFFESAVPIAVGSMLAIGLGLLAGATYLSLDGGSLQLPWQGPLLIGLGSVLGALLIGCLTMPASSPRISPDLIRQE